MSTNKKRRFYLSAYKHAPERPAFFEDLGNVLTLSGVIMQGMGSTLILMSPGLELQNELGDADIEVVSPTVEEWSEIIRQTDNPELFVGEVGGINKVLHRKQMYVISGDVQQRVWARDQFKCVYCGRKMGDILMTIDHFVPLELGGVNDTTNYVTACRACNKVKGMMMPGRFCKIKGFDFEAIKTYLEGVS